MICQTRHAAWLVLLAAGLVAGCAATRRESTPPARPLQAELDARSAQSVQRVPTETQKIHAQGVQTVKETGIEQRALNVGDKAPLFALPNTAGKTVRLADLLKKGPVVIVWYRGGWCPYCNMTLGVYEANLPAIRALGATLVALTPETPTYAQSTLERNKLNFEVLCDEGNKVARQYGIVFKLSEPVLVQYMKHFDLAKYNGDKSYELPLSVTYVIDTGDVIRYAFIDADYKKRAEPADVLAALRRLKGS